MKRDSASVLARAGLALACALPLACHTSAAGAELTRVHATSDLSTYHLRRVGVVPFEGDLAQEHATLLREAFAAAFGRSTELEIRVLGPQDLDGVPASPTFERGWTRPQTVIELGRRFGLDALLVGDVRHAQWFPPQRLDLSVELIAVETGMPVWSASIDLDAGDARVRETLRQWYGQERAGEGAHGASWELYLVSPRLLAEFAAELVARGY